MSFNLFLANHSSIRISISISFFLFFSDTPFALSDLHHISRKQEHQYPPTRSTSSYTSTPIHFIHITHPQ